MMPSIFPGERRDSIELAHSREEARRLRKLAWRVVLTILAIGVVFAASAAVAIAHLARLPGANYTLPYTPTVIVSGHKVGLESFCKQALKDHEAAGLPVEGDLADACL